MGPTLTRAPFLDDDNPATLPPCTPAPTTTTPAPKAMRPHNPRLFSYLHPPTPDRVVSSQRKGLEMNRIQSAEGLGVGAPPVFPSEAGIQRWGVGPTLTPTPFLEDTIPATLPPCTAAQTKMGARPQRRSAHTTPGCFPIYTLQLQIGLFPPGAKNSKRNESNQRRGWDCGAPPSHHSFEGRDPEGWGVLGGHPGEDCATVRAWPPTAAAPGTALGTPR